jgi:hypothetical protein
MNQQIHPAAYLRDLARTPGVYRITIDGWCDVEDEEESIQYEADFTPDQIIQDATISIPKSLRADVLVYGRLPSGRLANPRTVMREIDGDRQACGLDLLDAEVTLGNFVIGDPFQYMLRAKVGTDSD